MKNKELTDLIVKLHDLLLINPKIDAILLCDMSILHLGVGK